jgi:hypothetical protein
MRSTGLTTALGVQENHHPMIDDVLAATTRTPDPSERRADGAVRQ